MAAVKQRLSPSLTVKTAQAQYYEVTKLSASEAMMVSEDIRNLWMGYPKDLD